MSHINLYDYGEYDFITDIKKISNDLGKTLLVNNVEPLFSIWSDKNITNLYKLIEIALSKNVIIILTYYFPIINNHKKKERLKIIN